MMHRLGAEERFNAPSRAATVYSDTESYSSTQADLRTVPSEINYPSLSTDDFLKPANQIKPTDSLESNVSSLAYANSSDSSPSSRDSGFSDSNNLLVDKEEVGAKSAQLCTELKTIVCLAYDFWKDVCGNTEKPKDLLEELEGKIHPFLVSLDEELTSQEEVLRHSLDRSSITDPRVTWLLQYNKFQKEMRSTLDAVTGPVYRDLERVLRLRDRGCQGLETKDETELLIKNTVSTMRLVDKAIAIERSKKDPPQHQ